MKKILIVNDDRAEMKSFSENLIAEYDCRVQCISKAEEVVEALKAETYSAIILDIMMPIPLTWSKVENSNSELGQSNIFFSNLYINDKFIDDSSQKSAGLFKVDKFSEYLRKPESIKVIVKQLRKLMENEVCN